MFRAFHPGGCETVTELYATDSRDGEHSIRNQGLDRIEERFSKTGRNSGDPALDNAAKRIAFLGGFVQKIAPLGLVRLSSDLYQTGLKAEPLTHFLCDDSGGDQRKGYPARKMPTSTRVIEAVPLDGSDIVGVPWTRHSLKSLIVRRPSVVVLEYDCDRCSGCVSIEDSAQNLRLVRLDAWCGTLRSTLAAKNVRHKILYSKFYPRHDTIHDHTNRRPVRLPEDLNPEITSECVHCIFKN